MRRRILLPTTMVVSLVLAGCTGGDADPLASPPTDGGVPGGTSGQPGPTDLPSSAPTTQPTSRVKIDPNQKFEGGAHKHDWWSGQTSLVIMDKALATNPAGACIGAATDPGCGVGGGTTQFKFDRVQDHAQRPNIVYPGTGAMEITVRVGNVVQSAELVYQAAGKGPFLRAGFKLDQASKTFRIEGINETLTDPPHFRESAWTFAIYTTPGPGGAKASVFTGPLHVQITVFRDLARDLPTDPPHPDLWNGTTTRVLYSGRTTTSNHVKMPLVASGGIATPAMPDNATVLMGTGRLTVTMSWANEYSGEFRPGLSYCPAGYNCGTVNGENFKPAPRENAATRRVYEIEIKPDMWDSPYATRTDWSFGAYLTNPAGTEDGAFKGTIDWTFEIQRVN